MYYNFKVIAIIKKLKTTTEGESLKLRSLCVSILRDLVYLRSSQSDTRFTTAGASSLPPNSQLDSSESRYPGILWETRGKHVLTQQALGPLSPVHSSKPSALSLLHQAFSSVSCSRHLEGSLTLLSYSPTSCLFSSLSSIQYSRASYHP